MRIANIAGRLSVITERGALDVEKTSDGRFSSDPQAVYEQWDDFVTWARQADTSGATPYDMTALGSPAPLPRQLLAIGLNYGDHVAESGFAVPEGEPPVFTKFVSSITGPYADVTLPPGGHTDWEVELVVVIGRRAYQVPITDALGYVAGYTIGQDISERRLQMASSPPQFSVGKSFPGFAPMGPWLVTLDDFRDPTDLQLSCYIDNELMQHARTTEMIFSVPALITKLSSTMPLLPGDVIFTGTPGGVGLGMTPQRWLTSGEVVVSHIEGIGELRNRMV